MCPTFRRTGARTGAGSSVCTTPILKSSSEFSTSRLGAATSKCLRSTGARGHRKSSVSCGTKKLVIGLLLAATLRWSSGCGRRGVRGGPERVVRQLLAVTLRCSSGCGLRTRPARGTRAFVIGLLVKVIWTSCAGRGARAVLGMNACPMLQPRVATLRCFSGVGLRTRPARGTRMFVLLLLKRVTWRFCAGQGARAVLGMEERPVLQPRVVTSRF
mmetsp:Transcript_9470/g.33846  ORF Transcript_9470/g.33846 Transcript_9470/m.33846 type:complete len:215 (+) Transcript_9470:350-994(+)